LLICQIQDHEKAAPDQLTNFGWFIRSPASYLPLIRADQLDGATILSRAAYLGDGYNGSNARTSSTTVEVTLPIGTIPKDYYKSNDRHHCSETRIHPPTVTGWEGAEFIGNKRDGEKWPTVVEVSGRRIELA
jgi:hypothetical protein